MAGIPSFSRMLFQVTRFREVLSLFEGRRMKKVGFRNLLAQIHHDERGAVSLETILIIGAIALPILIFLIRVGWPRVKGYFTQGLQDLEAERSNAIQ